MSAKPRALDLSVDRARALALTPVSAAAAKRLDQFVALFLQWQDKINLVAASTLPQLWTRHIADSLQLLDHAPDARIWVDFGSGGGFPAIPIACALAEKPGTLIHLVESTGKRAAFLRESVRVLGLPAKVHAVRIENFGDSFNGEVDVVTARAVAPLKILCDQAFAFISRGAFGLFPKGQDIDAELTEAAKYWRIQADTVPSRTSAESAIVVVRQLEKRRQSI